MAKELHNRFEVEVILDTSDSALVTEVIVHYGVSCEYGDLGRRGLIISLPAPMQSHLRRIFNNHVIPQLQAEEGIT